MTAGTNESWLPNFWFQILAQVRIEGHFASLFDISSSLPHVWTFDGVYVLRKLSLKLIFFPIFYAHQYPVHAFLGSNHKSALVILQYGF